MALIKCSECKNDVSTKADKCPHCGAPVKKPRSGCATILVIGVCIFFGLPLLVGLVATCSPSVSAPSTVSDYTGAKKRFDEAIEKKYAELLSFQKSGDLAGQSRLVKQFENFKQLGYRDVAEIAKVVQAAQSVALAKQQTEAALLKLKKTLPSDTKTLAEIYSELKALHPDNVEYSANAAHFGEEWKKQEAILAAKAKQESAQRAIEAAERAKAAAFEAKIKSQFSSWDGSHTALEQIIKRSMNDPDSYKHVETRYSEDGKTIIVMTTFRGKNAFGGVVTNWIRARFTLEGALVEIISQG